MARRPPIRILASCQPGIGHLGVLLPIALALRRAGADVRFAAAASFRREVARAGFASFAAGLDWSLDRADEAFPALRRLGPVARAVAFPREVFLGRAASAMAHSLVRIAPRFRPHLVLREGWEYGAFAAARRLDLPLVTVGAAPYLPPAALPGAFGDGFDRLRRELGVAPDPSHRDAYGRLFLDAVPPGIQLPGPKHAGHRYIRPVLARRAEPAPQLPPGRAPLVYVTFGTVWSGAPGLYETVLAGLADLSARVRVRVLVSSGVRDPRSLGRQPPSVRIERRVAQHAVLPRCDLVIHHGGYNTTVESLACGVPALIIPISADQFFFAARCQAAGVARTLSRETLTPDQIAAAVGDLLANPAYRRRADAMARRMKRLMSPRDAARRILALARPD